MISNETGFWNETKSKLKEQFPALSDSDLLFHEGKEKEMMEMLSYKLGLSKDELVNIISSLE